MNIGYSNHDLNIYIYYTFDHLWCNYETLTKTMYIYTYIEITDASKHADI